MKKLLILFIVLFISNSCADDVPEIDHTGGQVFVKVDTSIFRLTQLWYKGQRLIIMTPEKSSIEVFKLPNTVNYQDGRINNNLIIVK